MQLPGAEVTAHAVPGQLLITERDPQIQLVLVGQPEAIGCRFGHVNVSFR